MKAAQHLDPQSSKRSPSPAPAVEHAPAPGAQASAVVRRAVETPASALRPGDVLSLQRTVGNRAVQRMAAPPARRTEADQPSQPFRPAARAPQSIQRVKVEADSQAIPGTEAESDEAFDAYLSGIENERDQLAKVYDAFRGLGRTVTG